MTATAHATLDATTASSGRLSSVASGVLDFVWPMYLTLVFTLGAWVLIPTVLFGWQPMSIISGSMAPAVQPGHVVVVEPYGGQDLEPGTVVTYRDATNDRLVTHRIASVDEGGAIITRGDANAVDDPTPLTTDRIVGVGRLVVPTAGLPALWAHQGRTDLLAVAGVLTVLCASAAASAASASARSLRRRLSLRDGTGRAPRRTIALATGVLAVVAVMGATLVSGAAFVGAQDNSANTFQAGTVSPPTGLTASCDPAGPLATSRTVRVQWTAASGATSYRLERRTSVLSSWQTLTTGTGTTYTDTVASLVLSSTTYRVRAIAGTWESTAPTYTLICL